MSKPGLSINRLKGASKTVRVFAAVTALQLSMPVIAQAHTTIWPRESLAGGMEKYIVRVPAEGQAVAIGAEVEAPEGVVIQAVGTPVGWTYETKRQDGRIVGIRWHMNIKSGEFAEFSFVARNPEGKGQLVWKLREFFADGKVTDYTNGPLGIYPTAIVKLTPKSN
jgi:uncharacterized protein YcnI